MDPATIAAGIQLVGGIAGQLAGGADRNSAQNAYNQAMSELLAIGMPPDLSKELVLKQFTSAGVMTPELEQEIKLGPSAVAGIKEDPSTREAQVQALQLLQQSGRGISPQDRLKFNEARDQIQRDSEAKRQQILQNFQQRGMGGSGAELATQLSQAQASANDASLQGDRIAATSAANALSAISQAGDLGGKLRGQDFDVERTKATAADEFERFNTQNQVNRQARNVGARNTAQAGNLANSQDILNKNTGMKNAEMTRANDARRTFWQDQVDRSKMRAGTFNEKGRAADARADRTANQWTAGAGGLAGMVTSFGKTKPDADMAALENSDEWDLASKKTNKYNGINNA